MQVYLKPGVFAAIFGRDLVTLDVVEGRYDLLSGGGAGSRIDPTGRILEIEDDGVAEVLSPFCISQYRFIPSSNLPDLPSRSALRGEVEPRLGERLTFAIAWLDMGFSYRGKGLPALFRRVSKPAKHEPPSTTEIERQAQVFHQLSPWAPRAGDCVFRCFMLLRAFKAGGVNDVQWVFGVRTWPFHAHCWLQRADTTLTDYAEPLSEFTPIFAL